MKCGTQDNYRDLEFFLRFKIFRTWWGIRKRTAQQIFISLSQAWFSVCHNCDKDQPCIYLFSVKSTSRVNNVMEILGRIFNIFKKSNSIYAPTLIAFKIYTKLYAKTKCYLVFKASPQGLFTKLYFITFKYVK